MGRWTRGLREIGGLIAALCAAPLLALCVAPLAAGAATFLVNTTDDDPDQNPGDGFCYTGQLIVLQGGVAFECTLRAAIEEANALAGHDRIDFSGQLPTVAGVVEIAPQSALPWIYSPIFIEGYSHPDYDGPNPDARPVINLLGGGAGANTGGLALLSGSDGSTIRGLAIVDFDGPGIMITPFFGASPTALNLEGNHVGVARGVFYRGNEGHGIHVLDATNVSIGQGCSRTVGCLGKGNVIAGNAGNGVFVDGASQGVVVAGNRIGTDRFGSSTFPPFGGATANGGWGIEIGPDASNNEIGGLGGQSQPTGDPIPVVSGNLVSGNTAGGLLVRGALNTIRGNRIGTNAGGGFALANQGPGVSIEGDDNVVGGLGIESNQISGNAGAGILVDAPSGSDPLRTRIQGNRVGVNEGADAPLGNGGTGIALQGDDAEVLDNVVGGNQVGIAVNGLFTDVLRNYVGTNANGDDLGNVLAGISTETGFNQIGAPHDGNVVGFNRVGLQVTDQSYQITIQGNYVGTDATGADLGNQRQGIVADADGYTIGDASGTTNGAGNVVGFNGGAGIDAGGFEAVIQGNFVGTNAVGADLGNRGAGIHVSAASAVGLDPAMIGGDRYDGDAIVAEKGNVIAHNALEGLVLEDTADVSLRGNTFWANGGIGIDLGADGATPNDPGDADGGANERMNHPVFDPSGTFWDDLTGELTVRYRVDALMAGGVQYPLRVDFFVHDPWLEPGDQARVFVGSDLYEAPDEGLYKTVTFTPLAGTVVPNGLGFVFEGLRATATDGHANTSELSTQRVPVPEPRLPLLLATGALATVLGRRRGRAV